MFGDKRNAIQDYLIKEGYDIKEFLNKNGESYFFKVEKFGYGVQTIKVIVDFLAVTK